MTATAIVWAATHRRREVWVGWPAAKAILSSRIVPGIGDRLAARQAYDSQMTLEPAQPGRPDNLFTPVAGPFAAHGRFDAQARGASVQWWCSKQRWTLTAFAAALAVAVIFLARWSN
ncbi:hypothetical protein QMO14_24155 [Variovorax sp. CAN2819]|uniref:hypothetical protein n=1 Tax=Variovorax sp. CAN15 TaxID=3046727 RepID=UPI00264821C7|nr:hypothetical protein [Variovorax sp. CAN15]MDN6886686.1 hypothetical protein [Variovorax sp. CAN15]